MRWQSLMPDAAPPVSMDEIEQAKAKGEHVRYGGPLHWWCVVCETDWPCEVQRLTAELATLRAELAEMEQIAEDYHADIERLRQTIRRLDEDRFAADRLRSEARTECERLAEQIAALLRFVRKVARDANYLPLQEEADELCLAADAPSTPDPRAERLSREVRSGGPYSPDNPLYEAKTRLAADAPATEDLRPPCTCPDTGETVIEHDVGCPRDAPATEEVQG